MRVPNEHFEFFISNSRVSGALRVAYLFTGGFIAGPPGPPVHPAHNAVQGNHVYDLRQDGACSALEVLLGGVDTMEAQPEEVDGYVEDEDAHEDWAALLCHVCHVLGLHA